MITVIYHKSTKKSRGENENFVKITCHPEGTEGSPAYAGTLNMQYYIYILTNKSNTLYTGVSNNLERRVLQHQLKEKKNSFTAKYNINKLIFYEEFNNPEDAIAAEKKIKGWTRKKKMALIKSINPEFKNLFEESQTS